VARGLAPVGARSVPPAISRATALGTFDGRFALDLTVTVGVTVLALALGASTLRRRTG
jgi:hypothetical protein